MRVAALYDIHGNLPALEAVLADVARAAVDLVVVGGDVVPGPMPSETIACLLSLDVPVKFIRGNGDREVAARMDIGASIVGTATLPVRAREAVRWTADQLDPSTGRMLASWPGTIRVTVHRLGDVLFCHATPNSDSEHVTRRSPDSRLSLLFGGLDVPVVVCGHTHMQFERTLGPMRIVNAGSVGMPFGDPGAYWLLLGPGMELQRTAYDLASAATRIRATNYPQAEEFANHNVLAPPSENEMLEAFDRVERPA